MRSWTEEELRTAVSNSLSMAEVIRNLGLRAAGQNFPSIRRQISLFNIDISHLTGVKGVLSAILKRRTLKDEEIFCENSRVVWKIRRYYLKLNNVPYICVLCGNSGIHNNKPLTLQVDHINGVHNDNREDNLRWLCPNCHSQTPTYAKFSHGESGHSTAGPELTEIICTQCKGSFKREKRIIDSKKKYGQEDFFCSRKCSTEFLFGKCPVDPNLIIERYMKIRNYSQVGREFGVSDTIVRKIMKRSRN